MCLPRCCRRLHLELPGSGRLVRLTCAPLCGGCPGLWRLVAYGHRPVVGRPVERLSEAGEQTRSQRAVRGLADLALTVDEIHDILQLRGKCRR